MTTVNEIRFLDNRTVEERGRDFLPGAGKPWLMPFYDLGTRAARVQRLYEQTARTARIQPGQQVLDVGGGTGNLALAVLRLVPDARATVLDPDRYALDRAARKAVRRHVSLTLVQGYADRLPAGDAEVDHVISSFALHHVDDAGRSGFVREAYRVLRPGATTTIIDFGGPGGDGDHQHHHRHGFFGRFRKRAMQERHVARNLGNGIVDLLTGAGFEDAAEVEHLEHRLGPVTIVQATR